MVCFAKLKFRNLALAKFEQFIEFFSLQNGLKLVLDVESYDYAYFPRGAKGFRVALSAATDQAVINQVSISSTIYEHLFLNKSVMRSFSVLKVHVFIFLAKGN